MQVTRITLSLHPGYIAKPPLAAKQPRRDNPPSDSVPRWASAMKWAEVVPDEGGCVFSLDSDQILRKGALHRTIDAAITKS